MTIFPESSATVRSFIKLNGGVAPNSHNVGDRISWNLRPPISSKLNRVTFEDGSVTDISGDIPPRAGQKAKHKTYVKQGDKLKKVIVEKKIKSVVSWKERRKLMQSMCKSCHGVAQINDFYKQFDELVNLYNDKFAKPGKKLVAKLKKDGIWKNTGFQNKLGYTWFEVWHHEGRRARFGAAMMAPDYAWWHGFYELKKRSLEMDEMIDSLEASGKPAQIHKIPGATGDATKPKFN